MTGTSDGHRKQWMTGAGPAKQTARLALDEVWPRHPSHQIREAIQRKVRRADRNTDGDAPCDLVVYNDTDGAVGGGVIDEVRNSCLAGRFDQVHVLDGDQVYMDVLNPDWSHVDLRQDYDIDVYSWIASQIKVLRNGNLAQLDVDNLIEELDALARRDKRELESRLEKLLAHLLKWYCQPSGRSGSWRGTVRENCRRIDRLLAESPSLRKQLDPQWKDPPGEAVTGAYREARVQAAIETGLAEAEFPEALPWSAEFSDVARGVRSLQETFGDLAMHEE